METTCEHVDIMFFVFFHKQEIKEVAGKICLHYGKEGK